MKDREMITKVKQNKDKSHMNSCEKYQGEFVRLQKPFILLKTTVT